MNALFTIDSLPLRLAVGVLLILMTTWIVAWSARHRSAALVHAVWTWGFVAVLCMPLVMLVLPSVVIPVRSSYLTLPPHLAEWESPDPDTTFSVERPRHQAVTADSIQLSPVLPATFNEAALATSASSSTAKLQPSSERAGVLTQLRAWIHLPGLIAVVWLIGVVTLVARSVRQWIKVRWLVNRSRPLADETWSELLKAICKTQRLASLHVRLSEHAISPLVAGTWRPVVLLPIDSAQWNSATRRHVLLHEAAHICRKDLLTQLMAQLACMLHWYNPLAWWGAARMKYLRELAADDVVLQANSVASDYASTLLEMARHYRLHSVAWTVAMARPNTIATRIGAILDGSRNRAHISRRAALLVASVLTATLIAVSCIRLVAMAQEPAATPAATKQSSAYDGYTIDDIRSMSVGVVDQHNQPVPDAAVTVSVWEMDGKKSFLTRDFATDAQGIAKFDLPKCLNLMRLWCDKAGYVPMFTNFQEGTHRHGELIPAQYDFQLEEGTKLSGRVLNPDGLPVEGAQVDVSLKTTNPVWDAKPPAIYSDWLASGSDAATTDKNGYWEIRNAPRKPAGDDLRFTLTIKHPNYAGDQAPGQLQKAQRLTTAQLRDGSAVIKLNEGVRLSGKITGPSGEPVTSGLVVWSEDPYHGQEVNETQIDESGRYQTPSLAPGKRTLTVMAPGFAPAQLVEHIAPGKHTKDFRLEPGHELKIHIVDSAGQSIPKASVGIAGWRNTEAIFNHNHPNVPDSRIPRQADGVGIYHWSWAPADPVRYRIYAEGYAQIEAELQAKPTAHEIVLVSRPAISGMVTDARTGKPVKNFRVVQLKEFSPDFFSTDYGDTAVGHEGRFKLEIDADRIETERYRVKVEAPGYRTALGKVTVDKFKTLGTEDFQLESAPALVGIVQQTDGSPASEFKVCVGTATESDFFQFDSFETLFATCLNIEGSDRFELPATFEPMRLRVFNESGFKEVFVQTNQDIGTIRLQPWPAIAGRLRFGGQPVANETVYMQPVVRREFTEARFQEQIRVQTDADGNFRFPKSLPGAIRVHHSVSPWRDSKLTSAKSVPLIAKPGEPVDIELGGQGATLVGKVQATGRSNAELSKQWSLSYLIHRDRYVPYPADARPLGLPATGPLELSWTEHDQFPTWLGTHLHHFAKLSPQGDLRIESIEPGKYDLLVQLYEQPAQCLVERIGAKIVPIEISTAQAADQTVDVGTIEVECRAGPRPGSDLRAIKVMDASQRARLIHDLAGKLVLLHVWHTQQPNSTSALPHLKRAIEKLPTDKFVAIGLNIDQDIDAAKATAGQHGLNWAQNFIGPNSDVAKQLSVRSSPAYYLVDGEGKLIGSSEKWSDMEQLIKASVK